MFVYIIMKQINLYLDMKLWKQFIKLSALLFSTEKFPP